MPRGWSVRFIAAATLAVAAMYCPVPAQADYREPAYLRLEDILGMRVSSASGENLGVIRDLIVDPGTHRIEYIVVEGPRPARYPVDALVAGHPGEVVVDGSLSSSAAGGSALVSGSNLSFASAQRGKGAPVIHLPDGKLGFLP